MKLAISLVFNVFLGFLLATTGWEMPRIKEVHVEVDPLAQCRPAIRLAYTPYEWRQVREGEMVRTRRYIPLDYVEADEPLHWSMFGFESLMNQGMQQ